MEKQGQRGGSSESKPSGTGAARVELIDNWNRRWPAALALIEKLGGRECLMIDEDGWLSARQNMLLAIINNEPAGYLCFSVQPMLRDGVLVVEDGQMAVEASVDGSGVAAGLDSKAISRQLLEAAMNRALELGCKKFHGKSRVDV